jgi:phosphohistidine phosphatase
LAVLTECPPECNCLMLVGHNPGLQILLSRLIDHEQSKSAARSLPTMAVAKLEIVSEDWQELSPGCARLLYLHKP